MSQTQPTHDELLLFTRAMANLVASDGRITDDERDHLDSVVQGIGLSPGDADVQAVIDAEFQSPGSLTSIVQNIHNHELKVALLRLMAEMSCVDGDIDIQERTKVTEAAHVFGFNHAIVSELIDWTVASIQLESREQALMQKLLAKA